MRLPPDHPRRTELNDEVHARPSEVLQAPSRVSHLALLLTPDEREGEVRRLAELAASFGAEPPAAGASHYSADLGSVRLRWERHTEFSRYMFVVAGDTAEPFIDTAFARVPADFADSLRGETIAAVHVALIPASAAPDRETLSSRFFAGNVLIGAEIGGGAAAALTDFRIGPGRFSRMVVEDRALTPRQAGRLVQRLLEIETYKTMALLAFPVARGLGPFLAESERELAAVTARLADGRDADEGALLDRLTALEAAIESRGADNHFRFGAAAAYHELVQRRIGELREVRIPGLQTFGEFLERRLAPAMNTCTSASDRQETLSERVARATQLLSTRIDVTRTEQNGELLRSMNRRAKLQLRLQETVEGLSIAAVTYYVVGLVSYAAKGLRPLGVDLDPDLAMAASIPVVLAITALYIRRIRRSVKNA